MGIRKSTLRKTIVIAGIFLVFNMMIPGSFLYSPQYAAADHVFCSTIPIPLSFLDTIPTGDPYIEATSMTASPSGGFLVADLSSDFLSLNLGGTPTSLGSTFEVMKGMVFVGDTLYGIAKSSATLYELDPLTGATIDDSITITKGGGVPILGANGLAASPTGELFGIIKPGRFLVSIDPSDGTTTPLGKPSDKFAAITFLPDGTLVGVTGSGDNADLGETLYTIATDGTATITEICTFGDGLPGEALAFDPDSCLLYHLSGLDFPIYESLDLEQSCIDTDSDGVIDPFDPCPTDPLNLCVETDGDGIPDVLVITVQLFQIQIKIT